MPRKRSKICQETSWHNVQHLPSNSEALLTSVNCFLNSYFLWYLALASRTSSSHRPRDGPWLRSVAIEPPRSISGEFDGNVMVDIARTHPSLTDPDITLPSQIPWKPFGRPHDLMTRAQVRRRHTMSEWLNDGVVARNHSVRTPH